MKLFKKVLAVALVGAMAVSMLTACGSSEISKVKDALKDAGIAQNSAMTADANDAMSKLQKATNAIAAGELNMTNGEDVDKVQAELAKMADFSFNDPTTGTATSKYDLYIWTNGSYGRPTNSGKTFYPYLMKVTSTHVSDDRLPALLDKNFVKMGKFEASDQNLEILKKVLKGVNSAGVSCQKVYGMDVLLVVVDKTENVHEYTPETINSATGSPQ
ncbi:MAG: hypothetical protein SPF64_03615 [Faecalibacterium longum]|nr:hypothetical protein [Faecalibacterium longum]